jgi:hypothetical protein
MERIIKLRIDSYSITTYHIKDECNEENADSKINNYNDKQMDK